MSKKMGRPPKKAKDKRSKFAVLRLTPAEHREIVKEARKAGLSISAYILKFWKQSKES